MDQKDIKTEEKILSAAHSVFLKKGMDGARMQEIAEKANINKALLHYYFRSKERLFLAVFQNAMQSFIPKIAHLIKSDKNIEEIIGVFVSSYLDMLSKNPYLPAFIIQEINRNPNRIINFATTVSENISIFSDRLEKEMEQGNILYCDPKQIIINIIALCVFPYAGRNMMQAIFFKNNMEEFNKFLEKRKTEVAHFVINAITQKNKQQT